MPTETRNSHGLFDAPIRFADKETIALSKEDIERQLDAGAFMMSRDDAIQAGFLSHARAVLPLCNIPGRADHPRNGARNIPRQQSAQRQAGRQGTDCPPEQKAVERI